MIVLPLSRQKVSVIDDQDVEFGQFKWSALKSTQTWYAVRIVNGRMVYLHVAIMSENLGVEVDHIDGDGLNNQRSNLRFATRGQNNMNRVRCNTGASGFRGVSWHKKAHKWQAQIGYEGTRIPLGTFDAVIEAAQTYDEAALQLFGEFARPNFADLKG